MKKILVIVAFAVSCTNNVWAAEAENCPLTYTDRSKHIDIDLTYSAILDDAVPDSLLCVYNWSDKKIIVLEGQAKKVQSTISIAWRRVENVDHTDMAGEECFAPHFCQVNVEEKIIPSRDFRYKGSNFFRRNLANAF